MAIIPAGRARATLATGGRNTYNTCRERKVEEVPNGIVTHFMGAARSATGQRGNVAVNGTWPLDADTSDDESLARLEQHVAALRDAHCVDCQRVLCGHESLFNVAMGLTTKPRCVSCLAAGLAMSAEGLRDHLWAHFQRRDCYGEVWRRVNEREGFPRQGLPACLWPDSGGKCADASVAQEPSSAPASPPQDGIAVAEDWDAGEMACGDLVLALRGRMDKLASRATLKLVARDPGAKKTSPPGAA